MKEPILIFEKFIYFFYNFFGWWGLSRSKKTQKVFFYSLIYLTSIPGELCKYRFDSWGKGAILPLNKQLTSEVQSAVFLSHVIQ